MVCCGWRVFVVDLVANIFAGPLNKVFFLFGCFFELTCWSRGRPRYFTSVAAYIRTIHSYRWADVARGKRNIFELTLFGLLSFAIACTNHWVYHSRAAVFGRVLQDLRLQQILLLRWQRKRLWYYWSVV